ncbi:MAG: hypothetical protein JWL81_2350 [Verrucomicrobiales bacterium]|nr:hypothetical protein [Verrucomicrobiales bacterium]
MSTTLLEMVEPLRKSPLLMEIADLLQAGIVEEKALRRKFYQEMTPEQKVEFIGGEIIMHSPARNVHLDVTKHVLQLVDLHVRLHNLGEVKSEKCLVVFPRNDYEPDIVFFGTAKAATLRPDTMRFPVPDFIVEVLSESTEARDRGVKFIDYAAHGVTEYWIIDAERQVVEQYLLRDGTYELELKSGTGEIRSTAIPGFIAPVKALFQAGENLAALQSLLTDSRT